MPLTWVDEKGRVKIPGRLQRKLGIEIGEEIIAELGQDCLILKKVNPNASIEDILKMAKEVDAKKPTGEIENQNQHAQKQIQF